MNYDAPTVRNILGAIRKDPLSTELWHNLLIHCFDQKDSVSFESYQIISDSLDNLVRAEKLIGIGRGDDGAILLDSGQREMLVQLSIEPNNPLALEGLGRLFLQDFGRPTDAYRIFSRAAKIDPVNAELRRWMQRCGDGEATSPSALDIQPAAAATGPIPAEKKKADFRRMLRVTSKVSADPAPRHPAGVDGGAGVLPAPVPVLADMHTPANRDEKFLDQADRILSLVIQGETGGLAELVAELGTPPPATPAVALTLALASHVLHTKGKHETALGLYQKAIAASPTLSSLFHFEAAVYHELGRREDAKKVYQSVTAKFPEDAQAWASLGVLHYEREEYEDAEVCLRKALSFRPDAAKWWGHLVAVLIERGDAVRALEAVDQLDRLDPGNPDALLKRGVIHLQANNLSEAEEVLLHYLQVDPASVPALSYLAMVHGRCGRGAEALALCEKLDPLPEFFSLVSTAWLEAGLAFEQAEDLPHALLCFKASVERDAGQSQAWTRMGLICRRNGSLEESEIALAQAVKADATDIRAWSELGVTRYRVGRFPEAAEAFLRAADLGPGISDWPYNAGVAFEKAQRVNEAARAYERAVKVQTDHASARINLGLIYVQQGEPAKAASCLQGLVLVRPDYARAWFGLGLVYEGMQKWEESLRSLQKAVELDPELPEAHGHLAYIYRKLGREEEAGEAELRAKAGAVPAPVG